MSQVRLRRVLITGAARGVGKALARRFFERGAELVLADVLEEDLAQTCDELRQDGARCQGYTVDVTDLANIASVRQQIQDDFGGIDILVNNAGVVFGGPFLDVPLDKHQLTYRVNVEGVMAMTHAFLPELLASPAGHLVYIASASGFVGLPNGASYASSKWAVIGFAESIRAELKHQGHDHVSVTTVCPTYINTGMFDGVEPPKTTQMLDPEELAEKIVEGVEKEAVWVREPWIVKLTPFLKHCLPTPVSDYLSEAFGANRSMDHWTGRGDDANS